jgi:phasin
MAEAHSNTRSKPKLQTPPFPGSVFTGIETPAAFRDIAEKSLSSAKDQYEKLRSAAEEATGVLEETYASATKGASNYSLKVLEVARTNTNAAFDFASELFAARSLSEVVELSTAHARKQFETAAAQTKELAALAQKCAAEAAEPIKDGMSKAARKVS